MTDSYLSFSMSRLSETLNNKRFLDYTAYFVNI